MSRSWILGIVVAALGIAAFTLSSCNLLEPTAKAPTTGVSMTLDELEAERNRAVKEAAAKQEAENLAAAQELERLRREAETRLRRLELANQAEVLDVQAEYDAKVIDTQAALAAAAKQREADVADLNARFDTAIASVVKQREQLAAILQVAESVATTAGISTGGLLPLIGGIVLGGAGGAFGLVQRAKKYDALDVAAVQMRKAEEAREAEAEASAATEKIVDSFDVLKERVPEFASIVKAHKQLLQEWQGPAVVRLVDELQRA